jgi:hypothetical protein
MNSGLLCKEVVPHSHRLGLLQIRQRPWKVVCHSLHCGKPDPSRATFLVISGRVERCPISAPCLRHGAEIVQNFALQAGQRETVGPIVGERKTALDQLQCRFLTIFGRLRASRGQTSSGGLGVLGPIEMFGAQHRISIDIPFRCAPMQLAPLDPEQGAIDCVPDQHMREQEYVPTRLLGPTRSRDTRRSGA